VSWHLAGLEGWAFFVSNSLFDAGWSFFRCDKQMPWFIPKKKVGKKKLEYVDEILVQYDYEKRAKFSTKA